MFRKPCENIQAEHWDHWKPTKKILYNNEEIELEKTYD